MTGDFMSSFIFFNNFSNNSTFDDETNSYTLQHHEVLQKADIAHTTSLKQRLAAMQLFHTYDFKQRIKILAQFTVNEQLAILEIFSKKRYNHRILTKHNYSKLTATEKALIQQLLALNVSLKQIAQQLHRNVSTVYYYVKRLKQQKEQSFFF